MEMRDSLLDQMAIVLAKTEYFCTTESDRFVQSKGLPDLDLYLEKPKRAVELLGSRIRAIPELSAQVHKASNDHFQIVVTTGKMRLGVLDIHGPNTFHAAGVGPSLISELIGRRASAKGPKQFKQLDDVGLATVRYLDYLRNFWDGRDKLRHVDWILSHLSRKQINEVFELLTTHRTDVALRSRKQGLRDLLAGFAIFWSPGWLFRFIGRIRTRYSQMLNKGTE